VATAATTIYY